MADGRLIALARLHGIETTLSDRGGSAQTVSARTLRLVLSALGVPAATDAEIAQAIADHERRQWRDVLPPVVVRRASQLPGRLAIRLPATLDSKNLRWRVQEEDGAEDERSFSPKELEPIETYRSGESVFTSRRLALEVNPAPGYHHLELFDGEERLARSVFIVCPDAAYQPEAISGSGRVWGPAAQLYAVRSSRNWGIGDFTDLRTMIGQWAARGAGTVGLNPLHALFPDNPRAREPLRSVESTVPQCPVYRRRSRRGPAR